MFCPSCNSFRPANNAPCPSCNAPAPLVNDAWGTQNASFPGNQNQAAFAQSWGGPGATQNDWGAQSQGQAAFAPSWGGSGALQNDWGGSSAGQMSFPPSPQFSGSGAQQIAFPTASPPNFGGSGVQQMAFPMPGQGQADGSDNSFWSQNMAARSAAGADRQQSLLPVPYQGPADGNGQGLALLPTAFPTISSGVQPVNPLLPALPDAGQDAPVYVAPMYTNPRPIIPRYRAISGLISVIIVFSLLCAGTGYYAQVTGKLTGVEKLFGMYTPPSISTTHQNTLPVPSNQVVFTNAAATKVIDSVGISNRETNGIIPTLVNQFTAGETIWLVCGANVGKQGGLITIKWYTDNHFYQQSASQTIKANQSVTAIFKTVYRLPTEGKAEVYWNNQLAATVLFVVEPAA